MFWNNSFRTWSWKHRRESTSKGSNKHRWQTPAVPRTPSGTASWALARLRCEESRGRSIFSELFQAAMPSVLVCSLLWCCLRPLCVFLVAHLFSAVSDHQRNKQLYGRFSKEEFQPPQEITPTWKRGSARNNSFLMGKTGRSAKEAST